MDTEMRKSGDIKSSDDNTLKTRETEEIYPKLAAFGEETKDYRLPINWEKVKILIKKHDANIRELKKIAPQKYRDIQFVKKPTLLGQKE